MCFFPEEPPMQKNEFLILTMNQKILIMMAVFEMIQRATREIIADFLLNTHSPVILFKKGGVYILFKKGGVRCQVFRQRPVAKTLLMMGNTCDDFPNPLPRSSSRVSERSTRGSIWQ
jgi:hypothetical protein